MFKYISINENFSLDNISKEIIKISMFITNIYIYISNSSNIDQVLMIITNTSCLVLMVFAISDLQTQILHHLSIEPKPSSHHFVATHVIQLFA